MLIVHYLNSSRAHRLIWLLEELGLEYEIKFYERRADMRAPKELKAIHPLGKSPVLEDDGLIIAESGAIFEYLFEKYGNGQLVPQAGTPEKRRYTYWMHYAEGSAMPLLVMKLIFTAIQKRAPFLLKPFAKMICGSVVNTMIDPQLKDNIAFWESELTRDGWFAGPQFTAADIIMSFPVQAAGQRAGYGSDLKAIAAYLAAIKLRPAYLAAAKRVGELKPLG